MRPPATFKRGCCVTVCPNGGWGCARVEGSATSTGSGTRALAGPTHRPGPLHLAGLTSRLLGRYCLGPFYTEGSGEDPDPKIAPCRCRGGQEWCHYSCLRQWQRSVLVTQPTHPAFYERDERQFTCNVCKSPFSVEPPSRAEMMAQFTGPELAGLLDVGCLIVTEPKTSEYMATILRHNGHLPQVGKLGHQTWAPCARCGCGALNSTGLQVQDVRHWVESVYLITTIEKHGASDGEDGIVAVNLSRACGDRDTPALPPALAARAADRLDASAAAVGRRAVLVGLKAADFNGQRGEVVSRTVTGRVGFQLEERSGKKIAVKPANLEFTDPPPPPATVSHYLGGPCHPHRPTGLAVLSATPMDAVAGLNVGVGGTQGGLWVTGDLDDVAAAARADAQRSGAATATVDAFWGDARWSRTQLLGEIARGSWGLCRAELTDLATAAPPPTAAEPTAAPAAPLRHLGWRDLVDADPPRLIYAMKSEMTDEDIHGDGLQPDRTPEEEDAAAWEQNAQMEETRRRLRTQLLARHSAEGHETRSDASTP